MSSSRAASTRPCPARMRFSPSISTGLVKPKRRMLSAIWRSCLRECVRALRGPGPQLVDRKGFESAGGHGMGLQFSSINLPYM